MGSPNGCVPSFWFCDYWEDCVDASDENCIDGELIEEEGYDVQLYLSSCGGDCVNVMYQPGFVLGGYQFDFTVVTVVGAEGGDSEDADFSISTSDTTVIAFSLTGATVECDDDDDCVLITVEVEDGEEVCIENEIISDSSGEQLLSHSDVCVELCAAGGDVNADGTVDILDVVVMVNEVLDGGNFDDCEMTAADVNEDGNLDVLDIVSVVNEILEGRRNLWGYYYYYGYYGYYAYYYYAYYYYYYYYYYNYYYYYYNYYYYYYYNYYYYYYYYYYGYYYYYYYYYYYNYYYYYYYYYYYHYYYYYQYYYYEYAYYSYYYGYYNNYYNGGSDVELYLESCGSGCVDVYFVDVANLDIAGFQFDITGAEVTGLGGGKAEDADFELSFSSSTGTILGFSLAGDSFGCDSDEMNA